MDIPFGGTNTQCSCRCNDLQPARPRDHSRVRLVIATCSVDYDGRLTAHLPRATRLLLLKADGSISIHADDKAYKPLNWMNPPCRIVEEEGRWVVSSPKGETLT